jgi:PHD/YefM family antitoxin component YafN of YafNO toxin-antitoxin module
MTQLSELTVTRRTARDVVENSADDKTGMQNMRAVYEVESNVLAASFETRDDRLEGRAILLEDGEPDFADDFNRRLALTLLKSI